MEQPLVLTFDIGTQSVRCLLVRPDGSFADVEQQKYDVPYYSANPGWAEQTPIFTMSRSAMWRKSYATGAVLCYRRSLP